MTARILVVDDLEPNVKLFEAKLSSEYFDVITATDGPSALEKIVDEAPHIVLLDVMMPGMDGFEVCRKIKENTATAHIPVVMVTALSDAADRVRGLESGADDFLTKPLNDPALFARVRSLVRLKLLTDEWRMREQTSGQFGVLRDGQDAHGEDATGARILLVDDSENERLRLAKLLEDDSHSVELCDSAADARKLAQDNNFDLILVDMYLKDEDALRFCSNLRSMEATRQVPILMMLDQNDVDSFAKAFDLGINDHIAKPVDPNELRARTRTQIRRKRYQDRMRQNYEESLQLALTDSLTGLYNRRYLSAHLEGQLQRAETSGKILSLLMFDIDHFKEVNDTFGHAAGDDVLCELARRAEQNVRSFDTVARYGGEEFVVVMPDTEMEVAQTVAERLRVDLAATPYALKSVDEERSVTVSVGVAAVENGDYNARDLLERADKALYEAKSLGRNRVVVHKSGELQELTPSVPLRAAG
ncbi:MAG TPA: PleD family two-component system response regulator, partial [Rhodospirillaceae bacterium]|nr:PleD family two-component system response regulator [Rhodospirillaceae bacterium]